MKRNKSEPTRLVEEPTSLRLGRILVPLDFSGRSRRALEYAVPLAEEFGGKISLVHVTEPILGLTHLGYETIDRERLLSMAREKLEDLAGRLVPPSLVGRCVVRSGVPYEEITAAGRALKADLIVISTQGRTGLKRVLIGSTAERVVRHAGRPVLAVRRRGGGTGSGRITSGEGILVPLDFSEASGAALDFAVALARKHGAELCLLHVVEEPGALTGQESVIIRLSEREVAERAKAKLRGLEQARVPAGVRSRVLLRHGRAFDQITRVAREQGCGLIVAATHGWTGLSRALLGSTVEQVVRYADCPVWVVRPRPVRSAKGHRTSNIQHPTG